MSDPAHELSDFVAGLPSQPQAELVSGVTIKTINGQDVLGAGDLTITATLPELVPTARAAASNETVPDGYSVYVSGPYEIPSGYTLEIGEGSVFEIG